MRRTLCVFLAVLAVLLSYNHVQAAELNWDSLSITNLVSACEENSVFCFQASNLSESSVVIKHISTSCGCTVASISCKEVPVGGRLQLKGVLKLNGADSPQSSGIVVETSVGDYHLFLTANKRIPLRVSPPLVIWHLNEAPTAREFIVKTAELEPLRNLKCVSSSNQITIVVEDRVPSSEYRLIVTPKDTLKLEVYPITLTAMDADGKTFEKTCYACIREHPEEDGGKLRITK